MPTLHRGHGWKLTMYAGDHNPPHFHIVCSNGQECSVTIDGFVLLAGSVAAKHWEAAVVWARANRALLRQTWKDLNP